METIDCADVRDGDMVSRYLADRLSEPEAEAFEAHYFACEACWRAVEAAMALRATAGGEREPAARDASSGAAPAPGRRAGWRRWIPAAAAAVVAVGVGVWLSGPGGAPDAGGDRLRGEAADAAVITEWTDEGLRVRWDEVAAATAYVVQIFDAGGTLREEIETEGTEMVLPRDRSPGSPAAGSRLLRVQALDGVGQPLSTSALVPVPAVSSVP